MYTTKSRYLWTCCMKYLSTICVPAADTQNNVVVHFYNKPVHQRAWECVKRWLAGSFKILRVLASATQCTGQVIAVG